MTLQKKIEEVLDFMLGSMGWGLNSAVNGKEGLELFNKMVAHRI